MIEEFDLIVIGGGSAGLTASAFGAQLNLKVALIEKDRLGGDCTWSGCVPSKALLEIAKNIHQASKARVVANGVPVPTVDLNRVMAQVRQAVDKVYSREDPDSMESEGIEVILGGAEFIDSHTVVVGARRLKARRFVIATGAGPIVPPIPGLKDSDYLTYRSIWDLKELPASLVIMGAGPIGCEMAQAFCRLGSRVTLVDGAERILSRDDSEASQVLAERLIHEGVDLRLGRMVDRIARNGRGVNLDLGGAEISGDALLVAVGRQPNVDGLGLEQAGISYSPQGIEVDRRLRTSRKHIYAVGDCSGGHQFTHYAGWQGFMAVRNAFLPGFASAVKDTPPWTTFTNPEVAHAGMTEAQARDRFGEALEVSSLPMGNIDRAVAAGDEPGFIKVMHKKNGTVLGATVVGPRAGEMIHEWTLAIDNHIKFRSLAKSIHVYPTYSMGNMQLTAKVWVDQFLSGATGGLAKRFAWRTR